VTDEPDGLRHRPDHADRRRLAGLRAGAAGAHAALPAAADLEATFDPELLERLRALDCGPVAPALTARR
jgi:hypothetical protein